MYRVECEYVTVVLFNMFSNMLNSSDNSKPSVLMCKYTHTHTHVHTLSPVPLFANSVDSKLHIWKGIQDWTNSRSWVTVATKFCTAVPNNFGTSVCNFLHITLVAHRILKWFLDF